MMIEIPDEEAAARREWLLGCYTLAGCRQAHDRAVAEGRLFHAEEWSHRIALLEWTPPSPPREFKVGDVVRRRNVLTTDDAVDRTVKGVDGDRIIFGVSWDWLPADDYVLVKAVDDDE